MSRPWDRSLNLALCKDDKCSWKYVGVSMETVIPKAEEHADTTGHEVTLYREDQATIVPRVSAPSSKEADRERGDI